MAVPKCQGRPTIMLIDPTTLKTLSTATLHRGLRAVGRSVSREDILLDNNSNVVCVTADQKIQFIPPAMTSSRSFDPMTFGNYQ